MPRLLQWCLFAASAGTMFVSQGPAYAAFEVALPEVGTEIQYEFRPPNVFTIAADLPPFAVLEGETAFSSGKFLRKVYDQLYAPEDGLFLTIILRGDGLKLDLLDELRAFDEKASLLRPDGSVIQTTLNSNYGYYDTSEDTFNFGWDYHSLGTLDIGGFSWRITPDVLPGRSLPATLSVDFYMWGSRLVVVPESASAASMATALFAVGYSGLHRWRRKL
jgi:hypothetical protein